MNRKLLGLALILSLSVIAGGCAQGEKTEEPTSPANTPTTPAAEPANTPAPAAEKDTKAPAAEKDTKAPADKETKETKPAAKESPKTP